MAGHEADPNTHTWTIDVSGNGPFAMSRVRRWLRRALPPSADDVLEDVLVVADELLANAYEHTPGPREVRLTYLPTPCRVVVEVDDTSSALPTLHNPAPQDLRGHGMRLINDLSDAWGVHRDDSTPGKTIWSRISRNPSIG
ncbi:ATP-binding protein [Amycolatopsis sp. CB00013]|uniref:ATP-binding protein n=1 Tax=Amycolatopsis sp. CB00013 TaxID=1703945 RepID=UPI00093F23ED|nr:ATP-binding protein [Amycolatopsis sp. CB00013]OKJ95588.1 hypothetical protein AMK34_21355 [Amycolatopsis sp. CB00013]